MPGLIEQSITCPYCGEGLTILVDDTIVQQSYIEDCQVCCRPIVLDIEVDVDGDASVVARSENE